MTLPACGFMGKLRGIMFGADSSMLSPFCVHWIRLRLGSVKAHSNTPSLLITIQCLCNLQIFVFSYSTLVAFVIKAFQGLIAQKGIFINQYLLNCLCRYAQNSNVTLK